jgi:hypothetical protein
MEQLYYAGKKNKQMKVRLEKPYLAITYNKNMSHKELDNNPIAGK